MTRAERCDVLESGRYCCGTVWECSKCKYYGRGTRDITCLGLLLSDLVDALADELEANDEQK